ncbi:MAG: hypothetical protein O2931_09275, partial [Planctomycetota bacterium]|nr:hypothetical protein [Planctomycetota bacterium]
IESKRRPTVDSPDDPQLEYAKESVDFVVESLKDQERRPDPELLEEMNWKSEDIRRFLERWEKLRGDMQDKPSVSPPVRQEWENALRSLGLTPQPRRGKSSQQRSQQVQEQRSIPPVPPAYRDSYRTFRKGTLPGPVGQP